VLGAGASHKPLLPPNLGSEAAAGVIKVSAWLPSSSVITSETTLKIYQDNSTVLLITLFLLFISKKITSNVVAPFFPTCFWSDNVIFAHKFFRL
jgi:hypothetical protein